MMETTDTCEPCKVSRASKEGKSLPRFWQMGKSRPRGVKGHPTREGRTPEPTPSTTSATCRQSTRDPHTPAKSVLSLHQAPAGHPSPLQGDGCLQEEPLREQEEGITFPAQNGGRPVTSLSWPQPPTLVNGTQDSAPFLTEGDPVGAELKPFFRLPMARTTLSPHPSPLHRPGGQRTVSCGH